MTESNQDDASRRQDAIETALRSTLHELTIGAPPDLVEAMAYSILAPGKRLRPNLTALACQAVGGTIEQSLPAGCAVEFVHTYSLIHDDLPAMDDDDLRRGRPTNHKQFGEARAILAGDALLTMAFEILVRRYPPQTAAVSCLELASAAGAVGMVGGQVLDLAAETDPSIGLKELERIHLRKTGALIRAALRLGVFAARGETAIPPAISKAVDRYAHAVGLAFQVTDDLLDVESTEQKTGKKVGKDAQRGKLTYPGLLGVSFSRAHARELVEEAAQAAAELGTAAQPLVELARSIAERDR